MDEPLSNLDAKLRAQTRIELVDLHRRVGTTIVYVTHDQVEAMTMATRVAVMSTGRLQQVGTPQEVYDRAGQHLRGPVHRHPAHELPRRPPSPPTGRGVERGRRGPVPAARRASRTRLEPGRPVMLGRPPRAPRRSAATGSLGQGARRRVAGPRVPHLGGWPTASRFVVRQAGMAADEPGSTLPSRSTPPTCTSSTPTPPSASHDRRWRRRADAARRGRPGPAAASTTPRRSGLAAAVPGAVVRGLRRLLLPAVHPPAGLGHLRVGPGRRLLRARWASTSTATCSPATDFREGLWHSFQFVLYTVPAGLVLGILLAVAAHRRLKGIKVFQAIFSSTLASSVAVSSVIFFFLFNPAIGVFRVDWTTDPDMALFAAALPSIWQNLGLSFVIVLAGLQAVPDEVMEAATLDGYGPVRRLFRITLPLISPVLLFLLVVLVIFGFQAFAQIEIITKGGPAGAVRDAGVQDLPAHARTTGRGAVMSVGLFFVTLVVTFLQFVILERRVHYGDE